MQELRALTGIRGLASLYVVAFHYVPGLTFTSPATTFLAHGYLAVDLFFVLSGYVMALTYTHMFTSGWSIAKHLRFLGRRVARIYPLYLITSLAAAALLLADLLPPSPGMDIWRTLIMNLAMIQSWGLTQSLNGPAWSISAEWAAYMLFPLLLLPCMLRSPAAAWATALLCLVVVAALTQVPAEWQVRTNPAAILDVSDHYLALPALRCLAEFCLGLLTVRLSRSAVGIAFAQRRAVAFTIALCFVGLLFFPMTDSAVVLLCPPLILALGAAPIGRRRLFVRLLGGTTLEYLGRLSYSIYLVHFLMLPVVGWLHGVADERSIAHGQSIGAVAALALTFLVAFLAYRLVEVPGRQWLRHVFEGGQAPQATLPAR